MPIFKPDVLREVGYTLFQGGGMPRRGRTDGGGSSGGFQSVRGTIPTAPSVSTSTPRRCRTAASIRMLLPRWSASAPVLPSSMAAAPWGRWGRRLPPGWRWEKARLSGIATVVLRNTSHIGRVGAYPLMAAREGMIGQIFVNAGRLGYQIAPFGGIDGRLSTNPIAFAAPRRNAHPILVDMTTSVVAEGKVRLAINQGVQVPEGWLIDGKGQPTTDPDDFKDDPPGAILPLGGAAGHKGYGLSIMVELLGGALSGQGCAAGDREMISNGVLINAYDIEYFTDLETFYDEVEGLTRHREIQPLGARIQ